MTGRAEAPARRGELPLHAETPVPPWNDSPYYPSSRRFSDQLSVSVPGLTEYRAASDSVRRGVDALRPPTGGLINRAAVWAAKLAAFEALLPIDFDPVAAAATQPVGPRSGPSRPARVDPGPGP